jgi:hypothetical protein
MLSTIKENFTQFKNGQLKDDNFNSYGMKQVKARNNGQFKNMKGGLMYIITINEMISSSSFKSKICKKDLIGLLTFLFENCEFSKGDPVLDDFRIALFSILENLAKNTKLLMSNSKEIMEQLLPAIVKKIESESADVRF